MRRAFLAALLASALIQTARGDHIDALKGINTITYHLLSSRHLREIGDNKQDKRCVVDWSTWRTNTEFVLNQSPELHFIEEADYSREVNMVLKHGPTTTPFVILSFRCGRALLGGKDRKTALTRTSSPSVIS
jgi:hypothetical protein